MAASFSSTERFRVAMINSDGGSERVTVQLSLEGLKILSGDGGRTMRSYNLRNVSSWDLMDTSAVIWTKSDVDLEERRLTLSGDASQIRNLVDTLASCCMQLAEVIRDKEEGRHLEELAAGGGKTKKAAKLPSVDSVEYWRGADKSGWLQAQSDVMKMWRRRWFVLKQGYLFRFLSPDVSESVKPRGVVDLSKVQDVRDGRGATGKANTIQLKTAAGGSVCYVCESETEMVEWISALEGSIAKIVKQLAGLDDSGSGGAGGGGGSRSGRDRSSSHRSSSTRERDRERGERGGGSSSSASDWAKQVERSLSHGAAGGGAGGSSRRGGSSSAAMVSVVGYGNGGSYGGGGGGGSSSGGYRASAPYDVDGGYGAGGAGGITSYSQIAGIAGVASAMDDLTLNYGGGAGGGAYGGYGGPAGGSSTPYGGAPPTYGAGSGYGAPGAEYAAADGSAYGYGGGGGGMQPQQQPQQQQQQYGAPDMGPGSSSYSATPNGYGAAPSYQPQPQPMYGSSYDAGAAYYQQQQPQQQQQQPQQQQQQQQQPQQQPAVSLIDQMPVQQPAYPYYQYPAAAQEAAAAPPLLALTAPSGAAQPAAAAPPAAAGAAGSGVWQLHLTPEGRPYYYNSATQATQWEAPPGM